VVDTEDLPLNVSREVTQSSPVTAKMRDVLTNRLLGMLEDWSNTDPVKYSTFFRNFGNYIKLGINEDFANRERIAKLLRFETSKTDRGTYTSLSDYATAMGEDQKEMYFLTAESRDIAEKHPNLEYFRKYAIEVLFFIDPVDLFTVTALDEFEGKKLVSIEKADISIGKDEAPAEEAVKGRTAKDLLLRFKEILGERVEDVIESRRLVDSVATLVVGKQGLDAQTERMMRMMDKNYSGGKKMLEVNLAHPLVRNLARMHQAQQDDPVLTEAVEQIYAASLLVENNLENPMDFVRRMADFMERATRADS
jgi:molecular chaperone HtpG